MRCIAAVSAIILVAAAVSAQHVPHQSTGRPYDDELYRHLIYNQHDEPGVVFSQSWVLPYDNPWFYIRLGSATKCNHAWRVTWREFHYWRAIVPVIAEQLTGTPYTGQVHVGCDDRQPEYGWIIVRYVTPEEYQAETGREWGEDIWGRATVGGTSGQIWLRYDGRPLRRPGSAVQELIIHEVGHAFGLFHTGRSNATMKPSEYQGDTLALFHWGEEGSARKAYRAGRGARYCGDPDRCGHGFAPGYVPRMDDREPPIVAN